VTEGAREQGREIRTMSSRTAAWLAWSLCALSPALTALSLLLSAFYRSKYDAAKTLEGFSMKPRDETDLSTLSDELVRAVGETIQPTYVSLWLRPETAPKGGQAD
jgi:hypothetical protein